MPAYYNEFDPYAAEWLRNLIEAGHIAPGDVDERSIEDVSPDDLRNYTQCHFFTGIGVWPYALRRAGWPDDRQVWTGSCPCQPWSDAGAVHGRNKGENDARDLWPTWFSLVDVIRPAVVFGEQVASTAAMRWYDRLADDLGGKGYSVGAIVAEASAFEASSRRERLFFAADIGGQRRQGPRETGRACKAGSGGWRGEEDLQAIATDPFVAGDRWPQPLVRSMDDGSPARVERLRAYGNAIFADAAYEFIEAYLEARKVDADFA